MKAVILSIALAVSCILTAEAKKGVVVAHYGSSDDKTRALTLDKITAGIAEAAGTDIPVSEAYISPVVRKNLKRKGKTTFSPEEAFLEMRVNGVDTLIVQPSLIIDGGEMEEVRKAVSMVKPFFNHIELGRPVCYYPSDFEKVVDILAKENADGADAVIFVGHGNELPSTATYTQLDYMLADRGITNYHVSTIEGYPTAEATARQLQRTSGNIKNIKLVPFLLVCGNHTRNDIAGEYTEALHKYGYNTTLLMRGLGEIDEIRNIYVDRVKEMLK